MIDLKLLRESPDAIRDALKRRGASEDISALMDLEKQRRELIVEAEKSRHELKKSSEAFAKQRSQKKIAPPAKLKRLSEEVKQRERRLNELEASMHDALALLPNIPHDSVPAGGTKANQIVRTHGTQPKLSFAPRTHIELAEKRGLIDFARGAKVSGSNFVLFTGKGARLERALINWMLDVHTKENGYTEISPPFVVNRPSMFSTGQLPKFEEDMYRLKDDDLFLVPTAEVPVTSIHRNEILDESRLPIRYAAYTACFRREAGSYGKDTRGLIRVHQFDKVELVKFTTPSSSYDELEKLVNDAEGILKRLGLHYRVVMLAAGELSFAGAKCYDLEAWAPGLKQYLEVSSCSNFEAFQARRANIKYRSSTAKKTDFVHTLNGSGVALARTVICLLETHQRKDGSILVPEVLRPYLDGADLL